MRALKAFAAAALGLSIGSGAGCVRMNEPDRFICRTDADCEAGQRCPWAGGHCVAIGYCDFSISCTDPDDHCDFEAQRCVVNECGFAQQGECNGYLCVTGECATRCYYQDDCQKDHHCEQDQCVPGPSLLNGSPCTKNEQCRSLTCCAKPSGSVCTATCSLVPDDSCTSGTDCASGNCCKIPQGTMACSTVPCSEVPECLNDTHCSFDELCRDQKCVPKPQLKQPGFACATGPECLSGECINNVCRGSASQGDVCVVDTDCQADRLCCPSLSDFDDDSTCGELKRGCPGSIGAVCEFDFQCIDSNCNANFTGFCTKSCTTNADCGISPWGVQNGCETNGLGDKICFPGCTDSTQCHDNITISFDCYEGYDSSQRICADG